ncbi:Glycosyltransferase [Fulvivirga imtechensis AK7]|uniref:Glycosyltransferase n=1 Tax=Fulvivirga imtechensis AK7 TaxID=1237149 RepID=L8JR02_9BACT|nr:cellulose synthase family protein [Fulvivirga imtechensis]ELR69757.1 Glycosyltransferase [Fulvivirga imtechensis AK7]
MEYIVIILYCLALLLIFLFSLGQLHLTWHYLKTKKQKDQVPATELKDLPNVTVQLPLFNEKYVAGRLIDAVCRFDYPQEKLEVQVLDDSTDETVAIVADKVMEWKRLGVNIRHIRREDREGFKAGALQYGLEIAEGEYIAIFDADFLPYPDFLKKTLVAFTPEVGLVQTRWGHLNRDYSLLTELQAFGLDAHFSVEQSGRNHAGSFINFNGTGGVWRKKCIEEAGGWSADTLTEDLDLSYRAQMKGWKFRYLENCVAPAELPVIMPAIKSQQYRWNKGAAETARKNLGRLLQANIRLSIKIHAIFHLFSSSVFVCLLMAAILSIPMLFIKEANPGIEMLFDLGSIFLIGFFSIAFFYWISAKQMQPKHTGRYYFKLFPAFLVVSMGMSLHNGIAVVEGLLGRKTAFIRTPKFNIINRKDSWKNNIYIKPKISPLTILEGLLSLYFIFGVVAGIQLQDWGLIIFHVMLALGFASVFYHSVKPLKHG